MEFYDLLKQNKKNLVKKWFDSIAATYPVDTSSFLKAQKDPFANPVGGNMSKTLDSLFDKIVQEKVEREDIISIIDPVIRIRAVQDFSPSQAVEFVFFLKRIIKKELGKDLRDNKFAEDFSLFEGKIDQLALLCFDIFEGCREKIYNLKANEEKDRIYRAFRRAGLITEIGDDGSDPMESNI